MIGWGVMAVTTPAYDNIPVNHVLSFTMATKLFLSRTELFGVW